LTVPKYKPYLGGQGGVHIGLKPIEKKRWLEIDDKFQTEISLKKDLLITQREEVLQSTSTSEESQIEMLGEILSYLKEFHNEKYEITKDHILVKATKDKYELSPSNLLPIELASLLIQEDLVLMIPKDDDFFLEAASLSSPSHWSLIEKFSKSLMNIHNEVPDYKDKIGQRVDQIFKRLPTDKILERHNWSIYDSPTLFQPIQSKSEVKIKNKSAKDLFLRVERQTIRKLPLSQTVLFTTRVHVDPIVSIIDDDYLLESLGLAITRLSPEMKKYKAIDQFEEQVLEWIQNKR
jgi:hypothetical protein